MAKEVMQWAPIGMNRDVSVSKFNSNFAYDIRNLRINATDSNTYLSWTTERGPQLLKLSEESDSLSGTPIGIANINNTILIFSKGELDYIYILSLVDNKADIHKIFLGSLGFSTEHPIETLPLYENENSIKVYWVDGVNLPRVINLAKYFNEGNIYTVVSDQEYNNTLFDFVNTMLFNEKITVERVDTSSGIFAPGVILYVFTYYNNFGSESNVFHTSSLNYISFNNRGASPEDSLSNSFKITITDFDSERFLYLRIYSIHRTSLDATPNVKRVVDINMLESNTNNITFIDDGTQGDNVDPTILLYIGGKSISAGTLQQKDNTLFLGNIHTHSFLINNDIINDLSIKTRVLDINILFSYDDEKSIAENIATGKTYSYISQLGKSSEEITTFKWKEYYRFGFLVLKNTGEWSEPIFIKDLLNKSYCPEVDETDMKTIKRCCAKAILNDTTLIDFFIARDYKNIRPLIVYPSNQDRRVLCLGVLTPTVFNAADVVTNSPGLLSSWFFRPFPPSSTSLESESIIKEGYGILGVFAPGSYSGYVLISGLDNNEVRKVFNCEVIGCTNFNVEVEGTVFGDDISFTLIRYPNTSLSNLSTWLANYSAGNRPMHGPKMESTPIVAFQRLLESLNLDNITVDDSGTLILIDGAGMSVTITGEVVALNSSANELEKRMYSATSASASIVSVTLVSSSNPEYVQSRHKGSLFAWRRDGLGVEILSNMKMFDLNQEVAEDDIQNFVTYTLFTNSYKSADYPDAYFVDLSILTFHSPDLEFDTSVRSIDDAQGLKLDIVGYIPIQATIGDMNLTTERAPYDAAFHGFTRTSVGTTFPSKNAYKGLCVTTNWKDSIYVSGQTEAKKAFNGSHYFPIYPWHKSSSLNNLNEAFAANDNVDPVRYSTLKNKRMSNLRFSLAPVYNNINAEFDILNVKVFDSNEITNTRVGELNYYGNVDKVIYVKRSVSYIPNSNNDFTRLGYPIFYKKRGSDGLWLGTDISTDFISADPISMKYKSTIHAILDIRYNNLDDSVTKPNSKYGFLYLADLVRNVDENTIFGGTSPQAILNNNWIIAGKAVPLEVGATLKWTEGDTYVQRYDCLKTYPYTMDDTNSVVDILSFMCETRVNIDGRYDKNRGQTDNLVMNPTIFNLINPVYSQRNNFFNYRVLDNDLFNYENYPYTVSWTKTKTMGEKVDTWTNITLANTLDMDGDLGTLTAIRKLNDTLLAFLERGLSLILYNENILISTLEGVPLEVANSGKVTGKRTISSKIGCNNKWSICNTENALYFIDGYNKGIYQFGLNLINLSDEKGFHSWVTSLDLSKSWTPILFGGIITHYDPINKEVMFTTNTECLAYSEPLQTFTSFYNYEHCPYFSTLQDKRIWILKNLGNIYFGPESAIWTANIPYTIWAHNEGDYNNFFGKSYDYSITLVANDNPSVDKIFDNIEFRADVLESNRLIREIKEIMPNVYPFNTIRMWNEYLDTGHVNLHNIYGRSSNLKQKFRTWRVNAPRSKYITSGNIWKYDRIRNPWVMIKLSNENPTNYKTVIHDIVCGYYN